MATKRFSINGVGPMTLGEIANTVVSDFAKNNPTLTAQQIRDIFVSTCKVGVPHVVETEPEYHLRDHQSSQKRSSSEVITPRGEKLYVSTQWHAKNIDDDFFRFWAIVDSNGWRKITL